MWGIYAAIVSSSVLNSKLGFSTSRQSQIRSAVNHIEQAFLRREITVFDSGPYAQTSGQIHLLARFHPGKAEKLKQRLFSLKNIAKSNRCS